jgi:hypothetical protein
MWYSAHGDVLLNDNKDDSEYEGDRSNEESKDDVDLTFELESSEQYSENSDESDENDNESYN